MAIPAYTAGVHHIGLNGYGFMLEGGYTKEIQKETTAGGGAGELGGNTDLIGQAPSLSRWTQDDFIGGAYAYQWGKDDAMFADCTGFMPSQQSRSIISCPPMAQKAGGFSGSGCRSMFMVGGSIYLVYGNVINRYQIDSGSSSSYSLSAGLSFAFAEYDSLDQKIWAGMSVSGNKPQIVRINTDLTDPSVDAYFIGPNNTWGQSMIGGTIFNQFVVCQIGRKLYMGDPPDDPDGTVEGKMKWARNFGRLPGRWKDSLAYNNTLYILINDGSFKSSIYSFDGDTVTPICTFPFNFYAKCMIEYAGRIFVGGTGTDVNGGEHYAELYEVTGASVRLVRSFSPETRTQFLGGIAGEWPQAFDDLTVHEGLLWMCQKGKKMVAYDITSDGFFGAAEILSSGLNFQKIISGRGRLWCLGSNGAIWRIRQPADGSGGWNPTFVSSDLTWEIATVKNWSEIVIMSRYGQVVSLEYSINSGATWTGLTGLTIASDNQVHFCTKSLSSIPASKIIRFRIKLSSTGDAGQAETWHRELVAFTVSFGQSSATQKKAWGITIIDAEQIETRNAEFDETIIQQYDVSDVRDQLWAWANSGETLTYRDLNGTDYAVKIDGFRENQPVIGPIATGEAIQNEAHFSLALLEV